MQPVTDIGFETYRLDDVRTLRDIQVPLDDDLFVGICIAMHPYYDFDLSYYVHFSLRFMH